LVRKIYARPKSGDAKPVSEESGIHEMVSPWGFVIKKGQKNRKAAGTEGPRRPEKNQNKRIVD
jgi:hypothetical protein